MALLTDSYTNYSSGVLKALSIQDLMLSFVWILFVAFILLIYRTKQKAPEYKYFLPFFFFKVLSLLGFVTVYVYYYGGGDSVGFWGASNSLVDLSLKDFSGFTTELFGTQDYDYFFNSFNKNGIHYPGWIVREDEAFFVSKLTWFFSLISGKNFVLTSLYFMLFSFLSHWRLYRLIREHFISNQSSWVHILFLFIPSVSFWCSGISKDTIVLIGILNITYYVIKWFVIKERKIKYLFWLFLYSYLLIQTREIIFIVVAVSFLLSWLLTVVNTISQHFIRILLRIGLALFGFSVVLVGFYFFGLDDLISGYLDEASIIQGDFAANSIYTGKKYSLGVSDFTITNLILASPVALFTGVFRPVFWESLSATLFLNGIESTLLLYLFFKKVVFQWRGFVKELFNNWPLLFSLVFVIIFGFITGLTSVIFGVLVRLRAPLLIFFVLILYWKDIQNKLKEKSVN